MDEKRTMILLLGALAACGLVALAAVIQLETVSDRADTATNLAEVAAWQVSQVLEDVRRITREAAAEQAARTAGELEAP
jgi:hypothetical protein